MVSNGVTGPLKGIKVVDWTMWQFGPVSTSMMGDMGADVIKIEGLDGDGGRVMNAEADGRNPYFETCNRSKRGIVVDLKTPEGKAIVYNLVKNADVFVQNFRQGVAQRLSMDYATLKQHNPMLVYGSANGYGPKGPDSAQPSFDGCGQARGGLMMAATPIGAEEPSTVQGAVSDQIGAIMLCLGVLAALVARNEQGVGQEIDASHLSSVMWLQGLHITMNGFSGRGEKPPFDRKRPANPLTGYYKCKDDRWVRLMMIQSDHYWDRFTRVLGISEIRDDPRFNTLARRTECTAELVAVLDKQFLTRTYDEWDEAFRANGDFIYAKIQSVGELADDPQVIANEYITKVDHPVFGLVDECRHPINYYETPAGIWREAPEFGQHTDEVLLESGYGWGDIEKLRDSGVIL